MINSAQTCALTFEFHHKTAFIHTRIGTAQAAAYTRSREPHPDIEPPANDFGPGTVNDTLITN